MPSQPEPYRIRSCERITLGTPAHRSTRLREAGLNVFLIPAEDVYIDLLSDSGTSAMSTAQWSRLFSADESFAHSRSYYSFVSRVREIFQFEHVLPLHQGRIGEHLFFKLVLRNGDHVPSNTHFGTTRANIEASGGIPHDLLTPKALDWKSTQPFKGDLDVDGLRHLIDRVGRQRVPVCMVTITNNTGAGQAVSLSNIRVVRDLLAENDIPFYVDAARFAENSYFVRVLESYEDQSIADVARMTLSCFDGCLVSAKKDGLSNTGGFFATNDAELAERFKDLAMMTEGFYTQGGCAARDLEAMARGIEESVDEDYLDFRVGQVAYLGRMLENEGVPVYRPFGGHAVFIVAGQFAPHLGPDDYPAQAICSAIYREGGVRTAPENVKAWKENDTAMPEFVRMSIPRRVYTNSHLEYAAEVVCKVYRKRDRIKGLSLVKAPDILREFTSTFQEK